MLDYVSAQSPVSPVVALNRKKYRLTPPANVTTIQEYAEYVWPYLQFAGEPNVFITEIGQFELDGTCNNPAVEVTI